MACCESRPGEVFARAKKSGSKRKFHIDGGKEVSILRNPCPYWYVIAGPRCGSIARGVRSGGETQDSGPVSVSAQFIDCDYRAAKFLRRFVFLLTIFRTRPELNYCGKPQKNGRWAMFKNLRVVLGLSALCVGLAAISAAYAASSRIGNTGQNDLPCTGLNQTSTV